MLTLTLDDAIFIRFQFCCYLIERHPSAGILFVALSDQAGVNFRNRSQIRSESVISGVPDELADICAYVRLLVRHDRMHNQSK